MRPQHCLERAVPERWSWQDLPLAPHMARLAKLPRQRLAIFLAREKGQSNFDRRILTTRFMDVKTKTHFRSNDFTIIDLQGACTVLLVASLPAQAPLEHNFRYPRIREHLYMGGALALGAGPRTFWHPPYTNGSDISLLYHAPKLEPTVHFASAPQTAPKLQNGPSNDGIYLAYISSRPLRA